MECTYANSWAALNEKHTLENTIHRLTKMAKNVKRVKKKANTLQYINNSNN